MGLTEAEAARATQHFFDYEWANPMAADKGSTEDVQNTRDISLAGIQKYGSNPVHCAWDSWAGHWKPKLVRKPQILTADSVSRSLADVVRRGNESGVKIEKVSFRRHQPDVLVNVTPYDPHGVSTDSYVARAQVVTQAADKAPALMRHLEPQASVPESSKHVQVF